jgi:hypothetical protein
MVRFVRLAIYAAAIAVVATARLPDAQPPNHPAVQRSAEPPVRPADRPTVRLLLAGLLLTGMALEVRGRRAAWR